MASIDKPALLSQLLALLTAELDELSLAARAAAEAATHAENKPENKYDTRGLEASYLAGAQSTRASELAASIERLKRLEFNAEAPTLRVTAQMVVAVDGGDGEAYYWILPVAGGYLLQCGDAQVRTITTQAPLGQLLLGKMLGDTFAAPAKGDTRELEVTALF